MLHLCSSRYKFKSAMRVDCRECCCWRVRGVVVRRRLFFRSSRELIHPRGLAFIWNFFIVFIEEVSSLLSNNSLTTTRVIQHRTFVDRGRLLLIIFQALYIIFLLFYFFREKKSECEWCKNHVIPCTVQISGLYLRYFPRNFLRQLCLVIPQLQIS